jgi:hypothetical protein
MFGRHKKDECPAGDHHWQLIAAVVDKTLLPLKVVHHRQCRICRRMQIITKSNPEWCYEQGRSGP